ncbi:LOG family protein [Demequina rhizosphaerae]|uniref:LOG family protein n=1 Tax=Demequina rhizosphaerae TaxID=1638985 RepID=UPI0012E02AF3|nr:LOG family protein [Demequina rhizosphaerae]
MNVENEGAGKSIAEFVLAAPDALYGPEDLYAGLEGSDPLSLRQTPDMRAYLGATRQGRRAARALGVAMARSLHDAAISRHLANALRGANPVAVMGGHKMRRSSPAYREVAHLAARLAGDGHLMLSGGGPGAMEATHLGARFAGAMKDLNSAIDYLWRDSGCDEFPLRSEAELVVDGEVDEGALRRVHSWLLPAIELSRTSASGASIGIPTWLYGHEPATPLATMIAKYYDNSIREDGLLAVATGGIVFAPGSAGTLQEVFQDAAQNYYAAPGEGPSPMVFLDIDGAWSEKYAVLPLLRELFKAKGNDFIHVARNAHEAVAAITSHQRGANRALDSPFVRQFL